MSGRRPTGARLAAAGVTLERWSRRTLESGFVIAAEGDRLMLQVFEEAARLGTRAGAAIGSLRGPQRRRARLRRIVRKEAARAKAAAPKEDLDAFADKVATLFDLVLDGHVQVADIAFARADPPAYAMAYDGAVFSPMEEPLADR